MKSLFALPNALRCTFVLKIMDNKYIYVSNFYSVAKVLVKESITFDCNHRKVILFLLVENTFKTAEINSVIFVHIIFCSLSIIPEFFPHLLK